MTMIEELSREAPPTAHEINRRVRQIERMKDWVAYNGDISPTMTTGHTNPSSGRSQGRPVQLRSAAGAFPGANGEVKIVTRRGRQRTPQPWFISVLCHLGLHGGQWAFAAEGNCTQGRECGRCGTINARTKHHHEWRYIQESTCDQVRTCGRCQATNGERISHIWSESWRTHGSKEAHRCLRCKKVEEWEDCGD